MIMMAAAASYAGGFLADYWRQQKGPQQLDYIGAICMLALRTVQRFNAAKPAVRDNWFEWDEAGRAQTAKRTTGQVSNDDLFFLNDTIKLFVKVCSAKDNPALVTITRVAIDGLDIVRRNYLPDQKNAVPACEYYQDMLRKWIDAAALPTPDPFAKSAEERQLIAQAATEALSRLRQSKQAKTKDETAVNDTSIKLLEHLLQNWTLSGQSEVPTPAVLTGEQQLLVNRVTKLWPKSEIEAFELLLRNKEQNTVPMVAFLTTHKENYQKEANKEVVPSVQAAPPIV